tara:strand:+ start:137 stop:1144 length:1008 start_codon:yes stop_codon:yes gene_type:complete
MLRALKNFLAALIPVLLLLIYLGVMVCLLNRWDSMVAITLIPVWVWAGAGIIAALFSWILFRGSLAIVVMCLCLITGIIMSEESQSIARDIIFSIGAAPDLSDPSIIRVVNVDADGDESNLHAVIDLEPDIVVVQNAPSEEVLETIANDLFGKESSLVINQSNAIIARGEIINTLSEELNLALHVRLLTPTGRVIDITNVALEPYLPSPKLWKLDVWKRLTERRIQNRRELRHHLGENQLSQGTIGRIISGGFGTPPKDDVYRPLVTAGLLDTFAEAGIGLGHTYPSGRALVRLDQIWVSRNLKPVSAVARPNPGSSHLISVADLIPVDPSGNRK